MAPQQTPWLKPWIERLAHSFQSPETQEWIQMYVLEPILSYVIERCFPYFLISGIIFGIIFILLIIALILVFVKLGGVGGAGGAVAAPYVIVP